MAAITRTHEPEEFVELNEECSRHIQQVISQNMKASSLQWHVVCEGEGLLTGHLKGTFHSTSLTARGRIIVASLLF